MGNSEVGRDSSSDCFRIVVLLTLLFAALIARLLISGRALWFDERFTVEYTTSLAKAMEHCRRDVHPPLYFVLMTAWRAVLPSTELSMRMLSLIFGMASLVGVFLVGRSIAGRRAGLVGLAIAAMSPYHWLFSTEARPYALLLAFSAFSSWAFLEVLRTGAIRHFAVLAAATALNLYSHYFAALLLAAQAVVFAGFVVARSATGSWSAHQRNRQVILGALTLGLVAAAYAPWLRSFGGIVTDSVLKQEVVGAGRRPGAGVTATLVGNTIYSSLGWGVIPVCIQALLAAWALAARRLRRAALVFAAIWVLPFAALTIWKPAHFVAPKYFLFTYPVTVAMVAAGVDLAAGWLQARGVGARAALIAVAAAVSLSPLLPGQHPAYAFHREDWRTVMSDLGSYLKPGDRISMPNDAKSLAMAQYYGGKVFFDEHPQVVWRERDGENALRPFSSGTDVWILTQAALPRALASRLGAGLEPARVWKVYPSTISLYHWVPPRAGPAPNATGAAGRR